MSEQIADPAAVAAAAMRARRRIRCHVRTTPLIESSVIGDAERSTLLFKAENFQLTNSFKARGAFSKLTALGEEEDERGLITASSGNHGLAASLAASRLGRSLAVVLPESVSPAKLARIRAFGVETILHGAESGLAEIFAREEGERRGLVYVSPYNDPDIVAGQATIALELLEQAPRIDNLFIAMGGGGLIGGVGAVMKAFSPATRIIGCAAEHSMALAQAMKAGRVIEVEHRETLADGVAGGMDEGAITLPLAQAVIDEVVVCDEDEIARALARMAIGERQLVEGAAGLALAGFLKQPERWRGAVNAVLLCGANFDHAALMRAIEGARLR